jgi:hypothetical protein
MPAAYRSGISLSATQFPGAIATLRRSPAYPARRLADPRV